MLIIDHYLQGGGRNFRVPPSIGKGVNSDVRLDSRWSRKKQE